MHSQEGRADVLAHVAHNLRIFRQAAGLSQQALAEKSGLSRRTIIGLEAGDMNISLASLDRLAEALDVTFLDMVTDAGTDPKRIEVLAWRGKGAQSRGVLLGSVPSKRETQLWSWSLDVGDRYQAEPDPIGWHEMVAVVEGRLRLEFADHAVIVEAGDFTIYSSAQTYAFCNAGEGVVRFIRNVVE